MHLRPAAAAAFVMALVLSVVVIDGADAAPKPKPKPKPPPCGTVSDPIGDSPGVMPGASGPLYDANLDIISADVANNATWVTGVLRVAHLTQADSMAPTGRTYRLTWAYASSGSGGELAVAVTPTGVSVNPPAATATFNYAKSEVRITAKIDDMIGHPLFAKGDSLVLLAHTSISPLPHISGSSLQLSTQEIVAGSGDLARATKPYALYSPSCVVPGP